MLIQPNPSELRRQYQDAGNLSARQALHDRFSQNPVAWHTWIFDRLQFPAACRLLEVGCGRGVLWSANRDRIPAGWTLTLTDFSSGMLEEARRTLADLDAARQFVVADVQALPFDDAWFDGVIANHMLYHVPDRPRAFADIVRVLKAGGWLYASTNGQAHLRELRELIESITPGAMDHVADDPFQLENGRAQLAPFFEDIHLEEHEDALVVPEAEALVAYAASFTRMDTPGLDVLERRIQERLISQGPFRITKSSGIFRARKSTFRRIEYNRY